MGKSRPSRGMRSQGVPGTPGTHGRRLHHPVRPCPVPCAWRLSCPAHWCGLRPCLLLVRQGLAPCQTVSGRGLPVLPDPTGQERPQRLVVRALFLGGCSSVRHSKVPGSSPVRTARISETLFRISDGSVFCTLAQVALPAACAGECWRGTACCACMMPQAGALPERGRQVLRMFGFLFVVQSPVSGQAVSRRRALLQRPVQNALAV